MSKICLQSLYDSIKKEPFKIPEDDGNDLMHTFFNPDKEGWLCKQGKTLPSFKKGPGSLLGFWEESHDSYFQACLRLLP